MKYPSRFKKEVEGDYIIVEFTDIPGCNTEGANIESAKEMAQDVLGLWLNKNISEGKKLLTPSVLEEKYILYAEAVLGKYIKKEEKL